MLSKYSLIIVCLLLACCRQTPNNAVSNEEAYDDPSAKRLIVDHIEDNTVLKFSDVYDSVSFIRLETSVNSLIGNISKIIALEDKYIILDMISAKMVFAFDKTGKFLNRIGKSGKGPEEYDVPCDIAYDKYKDELLVWDHNRKTIKRYTLDGTFVKDIRIDWWVSSISVIAENQYLLYLNNIFQRGGKPNDHNMIIVDEHKKILSRMLPYDENTKELSPPSKEAITAYRDQILFSPYYSNNIYKIENNKISTKYSWDFGKHTIPPSLYHNITDRNLTKAIREHGEYVYSSASAEITSHIVSELVYKRKNFDCYYSKKSNTYKVSAMYINDMYALASARGFVCTKGDLLVGIVEPEAFIAMQEILQEMKTGKRDIKKVMLSKLTSPLLSVINRQLKKNYAAAIESANFTLSDKEIDFINSVDEADNPIIMVTRLKDF